MKPRRNQPVAIARGNNRRRDAEKSCASVTMIEVLHLHNEQTAPGGMRQNHAATEKGAVTCDTKGGADG